MPSFRWPTVCLILGMAAVACGAVAILWRSPASAAPDITAHEAGDIEEKAIAPNPGYVGAEACARCHAERVAEFQATNHYKTFRIPEARVMPSGFEPGHGTMKTHTPGLRFEMSHDGDNFYQTAFRETSEGTKTAMSRIDFVLGAGGKADEVYLTWHGDRLYELPVAWLFTSSQWGVSHFTVSRGGDGAREMTLRCLECHNTWFAHVPGTLNEYQYGSFLMGVTCERCHGPGKEHVEFHLANPDVESTRKIVRPARLSRERQLDVCLQCHSNAIRHKGPALAYRPGEPLEDYYKTLTIHHTEDDHVANQIQYLRESRCFQNSDEMTCTSCHDPHRPERAARSGIDACLKCHQAADCGEQPRLPAEVRMNCVGCHMPSYTKINVNFETGDDDYVPPIRRCDHRIAIHPRARQEVLLEWNRAHSDAAHADEAARLTRSLVDDWLAEAEACRTEYRFMGAIAAIREAYRLDPTPAIREKLRDVVATRATIDRNLLEASADLAQNRSSQAVETLSHVLRTKPDHATAHGKIGTAYADLGQYDLAIEHWQAVAKCDPDDPYGLSMLGWLAYLQDRPDDAVEAYRRADQIDPFIAQINYHWSLALVKLGRFDEAAERFRHVLKIDPNHAGAHQGLAHVLRRQGQRAEALSHARRAARLTDFENSDILLTLTDAYADLGRFAEAAQAAGKALDAAGNSDLKLTQQIRQRLEELRSRARRLRK